MERRKRRGLTQAQLAERLNITDRAVSKWENGKSMPDSSIMLELCEILEITVNELLNGAEIETENLEKQADETLILLKRRDDNTMARNVLLSILYKVTILLGMLVPDSGPLNCLCVGDIRSKYHIGKERTFRKPDIRQHFYDSLLIPVEPHPSCKRSLFHRRHSGGGFRRLPVGHRCGF